MFGLVGVEVTLCLFGDGDGVLAFVIFGHVGRYGIAGCGGGWSSLCDERLLDLL